MQTNIGINTQKPPALSGPLVHAVYLLLREPDALNTSTKIDISKKLGSDAAMPDKIVITKKMIREEYSKSFPNLLKNEGIDHAFWYDERMKFPKEGLLGGIVNAIPVWVKDGRTEDISIAKSVFGARYNWNAEIDQSVMSALKAGMEAVTTKVKADPGYCKDVQSKEVLHVVSEVLRETAPSKESRSASGFKPAVKDAVIATLTSKDAGRIAFAVDIAEAGRANSIEFTVWTAQAGYSLALKSLKSAIQQSHQSHPTDKT